MPINEEQQARLEFYVELDKRSYAKIQHSLGELFKKRNELTIGEKGVEKLRDQLLKVMQETGPEFSKGLAESFDKEVEGILGRFEEVQKEFAKLDSTASEEQLKGLQKQQANIEKEMELAIKQHRAAQDLRKALKPNLKDMEKASEVLGSGFLSTLNKAKAGDIAGLTEAFAGGLGKAVSGGGGLLKMASGAAGEASTAGAALGYLSAAAAAAAVAIAAIAAAFTAVLAVMVMADEQAKEFNSTMLEGAAMADFSLGNAATTAYDLTEALSQGTDAAQEMAFKWRGQTKEFTAMLGQLNQAGLTYKEMTKGAKDHDEAVQMLAEHLDAAMVASKALGISTADAAEKMGEMQSDFGMGLEEIQAQFASVADAAAQSNMQGKRFFSVVSQATAGMALYNNRMEEAAVLLSKTSKILGGTDASDFIKSLTKGFSDQSYVDRFKTIMIAGTEDVRKVMAIDADKMAKQFKTSFSGKDGVQAAFSKALGSSEKALTILDDPAAMTKMLSAMNDKDTRALIQSLKEQGEDEAAIAISSQAKIAKAQTAGVTGLATAMDQLSMGSKLAVKLQGLGNQRISEMSGIELAAYQQYTGQSTEQIEALRRIDENLIGEWEALQGMATQTEALSSEQIKRLAELGMAVKDGNVYVADAQGNATDEMVEGLDEYTSRWGDKNKEGLEGVANMQDKATAFAQSSVENTTSILSYLQNTMSSLLSGIYDIMLMFYNAYMGISPEQVAMQREQLAANEERQADLMGYIREQTVAIEGQKDELSTMNPNTEEYKQLAEQIKIAEGGLEADKEALKATQDMRGAIERMETTQLKIAGFTGDGGAVATAALGGAGAVDIASEVTGALGWDWYEGPIDLLRDIREEQGVGDIGQTAEIAGMLAGTAATMATPGMGFTPLGKATGGAVSGAYTAVGQGMDRMAGGVEDPEENYVELGDSEGLLDVASSEEPLVLMEEQAALQESQDESLGRIYDEVAAATVLDEKGMRADKKWTDIQYEKKTTDAVKKGMQAADLEKLARAMGVDPDTLKADFESLSEGAFKAKYATEKGKLTGTMADLGGGYGLAPTAPDFVMRPGQPAQRFNPSDTILGMKAGGPLAGGGGGGGTVNITINGGDQSKVYQTVKDALKNSGLR